MVIFVDLMGMNGDGGVDPHFYHEWWWEPMVINDD